MKESEMRLIGVNIHNQQPAAHLWSAGAINSINFTPFIDWKIKQTFQPGLARRMSGLGGRNEPTKKTWIYESLIWRWMELAQSILNFSFNFINNNSWWNEEKWEIDGAVLAGLPHLFSFIIQNYSGKRGCSRHKLIKRYFNSTV